MIGTIGINLYQILMLVIFMINQIKRLLLKDIDKNRILFINLEDPRFINHLNLELLELIL